MRGDILVWIGTAGLAIGLSAGASASPMGAAAQAGAVSMMIEAMPVQYFGHAPRHRQVAPVYRRHVGPGYRPHGGYYYHPHRRGWRGDGVAAGVAAGALGALAIGGLAASGAFDPAPAPIAPARRQWCMDRYRSYNPVDGTFIDNRGRVRFCG